MSEEPNFDWKGESGDKFALANPSSVEETDRHSVNHCNVSVTELFKQIEKILEENGIEKSTAKVFDIGCSTGGKLAVFESLGFSGENLFGVDMSPMAVKIVGQDHPKFHSKEVKSFEYGKCFEEVQTFDLVYHSAVMCQIPLEDYDQFFSGIRSLNPKFYFFMEAINPRGYEKMSNSLLHGHGHHKHQHGGQKHEGHQNDGHQHGGHHQHEGHQNEGHQHHGHQHYGHQQEGHQHGGHQHEGHHKSHDEEHHHCENKHHENLAEILDKGFHYTNDIEKVVSEKFPEAKQIFRRRLDYTEATAPKFQAVHFDYFLLSLYKL